MPLPFDDPLLSNLTCAKVLVYVLYVACHPPAVLLECGWG